MRSCLILCLLLLSNVVYGRDPAARLELSVDSLPFFVFEDDRVLVMPQLLRNEPLPPRGRVEHPGYKGTVTLAIGTRLESFSLQVPYYNEQVALAHFPIDLADLAHEAELIFKGKLEESKREVEARAVVLKIGNTMPVLQMVNGRVQDAKGRQVIFAVPRPDQEQGRLWYPVRVAEKTLGPPPASVLIAGMQCGNGAYARALGQAFGSGTETRQILLPGEEVPIVELLLKLLSEPEKSTDAVYIVPGSADIEHGTPPDRYAMALHAILSLYRCRSHAPRFLILAVPFSPGEQKRARAYRQATFAVAKEQAVRTVDLASVFSRNGSQMRRPDPDEEQHKQIAKHLHAATGTEGWDMLVLLIPGLLVLGGWAALAWLWLGARMKKKGSHG